MNALRAVLQRPKAPAVLVVLAFVTLYLVWGSTYLAIRFAIESIPPFLMVGVRYVVAGALLYGWVVLRGEATRTTAAQWRAATLFGTLFFLFGNGGVTIAETRISSGIAAVFIAMIPITVTLIEWAHRKGPRPTPLATTGLLLGFGGVALLVLRHGASAAGAVDPLGALACILADVGWCYGTVFAKGAPKPPSLLQTVAMQMLAGGVVVLILATAIGEWRGFRVESVTPRSIAAFFYLVFFGSILAFTAFSYLLHVTRPSRVATYAFVNPIVAMFLGWALGGEEVTGRILVAGAAVVTGVILILRSRSRSDTPQASEAAATSAGASPPAGGSAR